MIRSSPWPELDRLARFVRASDSLTESLATWTGLAVHVEILNRSDDVGPDPLVADVLALPDGARVQHREVRMRCGDVVVATARSWVAASSAALTPRVRLDLRTDAALGAVLRPLHRRRVALRVATLQERPTGDPATPVLDVSARLDVAGTPVAWCTETVLEAVVTGRARRRLGVAA